MRGYRLFIALLFCGVLGIYSCEILAQEGDIQAQEARAVYFRRKLDSLLVRRSQLIDEADIVVQQIDILKTQEHISSAEHRKLEKQLQKSQIFEEQVQDVDSKIEETNKTYRQTVESLVALYNKEIEQSVHLMEKEDIPNENLLEQFQTLLRKKQSWEAKLFPHEFSAYPDFEVALETSDSERDLKIKADILRDQEEAFRRVIRVLEKRIRSLKEEEKIRIKVVELSGEMDLFDEREELFGKKVGDVSSEGTSLDNQGKNRSGTFHEEISVGNLNTIVEILPYMENLKSDIYLPTPRSLSAIHGLIRRLEYYQTQLTTRADHLKEKADRFYEKAEGKWE